MVVRGTWLQNLPYIAVPRTQQSQPLKKVHLVSILTPNPADKALAQQHWAVVHRTRGGSVTKCAWAMLGCLVLVAACGSGPARTTATQPFPRQSVPLKQNRRRRPSPAITRSSPRPAAGSSAGRLRPALTPTVPRSRPPRPSIPRSRIYEAGPSRRVTPTTTASRPSS